MGVFGIGPTELILILIILVFIFGATRIKSLAKGLGEGVREFKKATSESPDDTEDINKSIIELAQKQGIVTEGKGIKQILKEIEELEKEKS
jgi:sec-independent protein translocase protein TatA